VHLWIYEISDLLIGVLQEPEMIQDDPSGSGRPKTLPRNEVHEIGIIQSFVRNR
jgi:hypothetical protein